MAEPEFLDDGPIKPVRIWGRAGRRPIFAAGNSNGDIEMLEFTRGLRLLVLHDDAEREFDYTAGAEKSLERAARALRSIFAANDHPISSPIRAGNAPAPGAEKPTSCPCASTATRVCCEASAPVGVSVPLSFLASGACAP